MKRIAKNNFFIRKQSNNQNNMKKTWDTVYDFIGKKKNYKSSHQNIREVTNANGDSVTNEKDIAASFNTHFNSV